MRKIFKCTLTFGFAFFMIGSVYAAEATIDCGGGIIGIPIAAAKILNTIYILLKIGTPVILVFTGMLDFGKSVMSGSEDDIKKHQKRFIKRCISAAAVFLIISIVELGLNLLMEAGFMNAKGCIDAIIRGNFK